ncbi:hypothetical protein Tco_1540750 [Tanacetum coccineum]
MEHFTSTFCNVSGNNAKAIGSASGKAQQVEHVVGQHGSGGSGVVVVIDLSAAGGQLVMHVLGWKRMGDGIPTQSSVAGGASEWSIL